MALDTKVIPFVFDQVTNLQTSIIEAGRYKNGSLWLPAGFTTANLTFLIGSAYSASFHPFGTVSIASAAASTVYPMDIVLPYAIQFKIVSASAQDPALTCYLFLKD